MLKVYTQPCMTSRISQRLHKYSFLLNNIQLGQGDSRILPSYSDRVFSPKSYSFATAVTTLKQIRKTPNSGVSKKDEIVWGGLCSEDESDLSG